MSNSVPDSKMPALLAFGFAGIGLVIALITGFSKASIAGGVIAGLGAIPAVFGMWKGIQQETQTTLALSVFAVLVALAMGAILIVVGVISWVK
ncbi:MAG: hypothetical protein IPI49_18025 [Myxococcales bacterium]|nr:hypothetical protein [Myxococcales bacterium]HRC58601.1 hypothetical protein [Kofleriaceae bacterium]